MHLSEPMHAGEEVTAPRRSADRLEEICEAQQARLPPVFFLSLAPTMHGPKRITCICAALASVAREAAEIAMPRPHTTHFNTGKSCQQCAADEARKDAAAAIRQRFGIKEDE